MAEVIIGTSIKIDNLEVAQHDFQDVMTWGDAKSACATLGEGWRLPTKDELNLLYKNKDKIGGFTGYGFDGDFYWSSTLEKDFSPWCQAFDTGFQCTITYQNDMHSVRAVRAF